ncbi:MAG: hypothetical protein PHE61_07405 [Candidatus Omnitrophica bacterium]|nr:hypothetical protein [Candidatus Omnitrophota bacterium]
MKRQLLSFLVIVTCFSAFSIPQAWGAKASAANKNSKAPAVNKSSKAPADNKYYGNGIILVDDFNDETVANVLGGETGGDEVFPGTSTVGFTRKKGNTLGNYGSALQINYNVLLPAGFVFYYQRLGEPESLGSQASYPLDLSGYKYLSFWIKTDIEKPKFAVEFHQDSEGDRKFILGKDITAKVVAGRYVIGKDPKAWRKVVIPLKDFRAVKDWSQILEMDFLFEERLHSGMGTVYVDDIVFGKNYPREESAVSPLAGVAQPVQGSTLTDLVSATSYLKGDNSPVAFIVSGEPAVDGFLLRDRMPLEFHLKTPTQDLENVRFEVKDSAEPEWGTVASFYDHKKGVYKATWRPGARDVPTSYELRVTGYDVDGDMVVLAGPFKSKRYDRFFV